MPQYAYTSQTGKTEFRVFPMTNIPRRIRLANGEWARRDIPAEHRQNTRCLAGNWPQKSWSLGVNPDQVAEATKAAAVAGVPTEYAKDGDVIFRDRAHRRKFMKAFGYYDRSAGYGDAMPQNVTGEGNAYRRRR